MITFVEEIKEYFKTVERIKGTSVFVFDGVTMVLNKSTIDNRREKGGYKQYQNVVIEQLMIEVARKEVRENRGGV